jgi:replication-associated recombination protein RarA
MEKRKSMGEKTIVKRPRHQPRVKVENAPPINSLEDIIELGHTIVFYKNIDAVTLWRIAPYVEQLNNMVGMKDLKESIFGQIMYYLQGMHLRNSDGEGEYLHTMIYGPPGCGKTTVAWIISKIYQALGILTVGSFKAVHRDDFIAGYLGQTAIKTTKLLKSCVGGVLFIDEVYSLAPRDNDRDSFSKEALDTLISFLSEHKNDFCCIAAGYEEEIQNCFFGMNKGLKRRFPWVHRIKPYTPEELGEIFLGMTKKISWGTCLCEGDLSDIFRDNADMFKNAGGDIETYLTKCKISHSIRIMGLDEDHKFILTKEDLDKGLGLMKLHQAEADKTLTSPPMGMYT